MVVVVMVMMTFAKFFTCIPEPIPGYCLSYAKMTHYASFVWLCTVVFRKGGSIGSSKFICKMHRYRKHGVVMTIANFFTCIPEPIPSYCLSYAKLDMLGTRSHKSFVHWVVFGKRGGIRTLMKFCSFSVYHGNGSLVCNSKIICRSDRTQFWWNNTGKRLESWCKILLLIDTTPHENNVEIILDLLCIDGT